jgi:Tat protein translocase TatB subunit
VPFNLGWSEIMMVLFLALLFVGPKKLPELAAGLGKMIREFRKATSDIKGEIQIEEHLRKPFEDLRDAVTLPAEELKRRDVWKAEWETRQKEEEERAAQAEKDAAAGLNAAPDGENVEAHAGLPTEPPEGITPGESVAETPSFPADLGPGAVSNSDRTIAQALPSALAAERVEPDATVAAERPGLPSMPPALSRPVAPPPGTVGTPQSKSSPLARFATSPLGRPPVERTELGVGNRAGDATAEHKPLPTPPPPPPAASRLPLPGAPGRSVPSPDKKIG